MCSRCCSVGSTLGFLLEYIQREEIPLKLNTGIHDKICLHMHICSHWVTHESIINTFSVVCYRNIQDNVALWGKMQDKNNMKYPGVSAGGGGKVGKKEKQHFLASFYSSLVSAENCACIKITLNFHLQSLRHSQ